MSRAEATGELPDEVDRGRASAMQIAAQFSLDQGRVADDTGATNITFRGKMNIAARANRSAEAGGDFVISEIDVGAACWTDCRCCGAADLVFSLAFETFDN